MSTTNWSQNALTAAALDRGVTVSRRRKGSGIHLSYEGRSFVWANNFSTFNSLLARRMTTFKDVQARYFRNYDIPFPDNAIFAKGDQSRAWAWAEQRGPLVLKPHDGGQGRDVHVEIDNWIEFRDIFNELSNKYGRVLVERFYSGIEHRAFVVDHKVVGVIRRRPAGVVGNGKSTIRRLIEEKNADRGIIHKPIPLGDVQSKYLGKQGLSPESILGQGRRVSVHPMSNLHRGGDAIDATEDVSDSIKRTVERASAAVPGLRAAGFDVLVPEDSDSGDMMMIEVNHWAMVSLHHFPWEGKPRDVAGEILDSMFPGVALR